MSLLNGRRIVLGVTGGIAAYKAVDVCRRLVDAGAHVSVVMTEGALRMVGEVTFTALSSEPVKTSIFDQMKLKTDLERNPAARPRMIPIGR